MKSTRKVLSFFVQFLAILRFASGDVIHTHEGDIEGSVMETRSGVQFHAFRKVPFAEPPIGPLRFLAPVPKSSWEDVLNCTSYGPVCMQRDTFGNGMETSEDCLHLNVFTKNLPSATNDQLKPVIAYIHGGGFETGSAVEHGPEYLMDRDIVLVTINYRLGVFGFMAIETSEISGNQGLKDQALAFKWIHRNIHHFGGDPAKVTIAGLSAGGYSVTAHMVSSMSAGLFINVIAMSGAIAWQKKLKTNNIEAVKNLSNKLNCSTESIDDVVECLQSVSTILSHCL